MNQSLKKTLQYSLVVLCFGFALLEVLEGQNRWVFWLAAGCAVLSWLLYDRQKESKTQRKTEQMISVLPAQAKEALAQGKIPELTSDLKLASGEKLLWSDLMRTDYYGSKPHLFYLTDRRMVCLDDDFRFSHPVDSMTIVFDPKKILIRSGQSALSFQCADPQALQAAWNTLNKA